jgi:hypothetical protein
VFATGHGERDPHGQQNHGLGDLGKRLADRGFRMQAHNTLADPLIPDNTHVLVIAGPSVAYLPGETGLIADYIEQGGNLLWLMEPDGKDYGLTPLARQLGIRLLPGVVIDTTARTLGISEPDFTLVTNYAATPLTPGFSQFTLYPQAAHGHGLARGASPSRPSSCAVTPRRPQPRTPRWSTAGTTFAWTPSLPARSTQSLPRGDGARSQRVRQTAQRARALRPA